jgi:hypothetical protein
LLPRDCELHRTLQVLRTHGREHDVRARCALRAEAAANVPGNDANLPCLEPEHLRDGLRDAPGALVRVVQREPAVLPDRDRGVRLHRIVVLGGSRVRRIDRDRRRCERLLDVTLLGVGREVRVDLVRLVEPRVVRAELDVVLGDLVVDVDEARRMARGLEVVRDDAATICPR